MISIIRFCGKNTDASTIATLWNITKQIEDYQRFEFLDYYVNVNSDRGPDEDGYSYTMQITPTMPLCYVWSPV